MQLRYPKSRLSNPTNILRRAGYSFFRDPRTGKESYVLRLQSGYYPRFHLYLKDDNDHIILDLHLDQKKPSYKGTAMHSGEYDGPVVAEELARIDRWAQHLTDPTTNA
jgi:hypothetical protein